MILRDYVAGGSENAIQPGFKFDRKGNVDIVATQSTAKARAKQSGATVADDISLPDGRVLTRNEWRDRLYDMLGPHVEAINQSLQSGECCTALTILRQQFAAMMEEAGRCVASEGSGNLQTSAQNPSTWCHRAPCCFGWEGARHASGITMS